MGWLLRANASDGNPGTNLKCSLIDPIYMIYIGQYYDHGAKLVHQKASNVGASIPSSKFAPSSSIILTKKGNDGKPKDHFCSNGVRGPNLLTR